MKMTLLEDSGIQIAHYHEVVREAIVSRKFVNIFSVTSGTIEWIGTRRFDIVVRVVFG